ncbi:MAG: extracellular solute-binding protein [Clostridiales bacterium]|jgi:multiple sugar transport system substrate-binding protein|nr:extracellular solute-binding protein [Clostridiales bacterium]
MKKFFKRALLLTAAVCAVWTPFGGAAYANENAAGKTLTISVFVENEVLNAAARKFEESHAGVNVDIVPLFKDSSEINGMAYENDVQRYSQQVNTALISGGGEDIISVGEITWSKLADRGKLADLNEYLTFPEGAYYQNVLDAFLYKGKRYTVPLCFSFDVAIRDADFDRNNFIGAEPPTDLSMDELFALADNLDTPLFNYGTERHNKFDQINIAAHVFNVYFKDFIDMENKKADVNNETFVSLLKSVQALHNAGKLYPGDRVGSLNGLITIFQAYSPLESSLGVIDYTGMFFISGSGGQNRIGANGLLNFMPAINANSQHKALAAEFITFLLSDEMQTSPEIMFFSPVNKKAAAEMARLNYESYRNSGIFIPEGFDLEKNIAAFEKLANRLTHTDYNDRQIQYFVRAEMERYFGGETSAEQAAQNLQSKLTLYLQE